MPYTPHYPGGWLDAPNTSTPIVATALNTIESGIKNLSVALVLPSGDTSGATDVANINNVIANGGKCQLVQTPLSAPYWINSPLLPTSQSALWGAQRCAASNWDNYSANVGNPVGTIIAAVPSFTGTAFISMPNSTGTQYYGVDLKDFYLDGNNFTGSTTHGMYVDGAWGACFMSGVTIWRLRGSGSCLYMTYDTNSGYIPDEWIIEDCKFSAAYGSGQAGVYLADLCDSIFSNCRSASHNGPGWQVALGQNTKFIGCKGENNSGAGFYFTGLNAGNPVDLIGCSTNANGLDGFLFDNTGGTGLGTYTLAGCRSSNDNSSSTSGRAGFRANACKSRIVASGCTVIGTTQVYGASEVNASYGMCFTGSYLSGSSAATHDDASNTHALVNQSPVPF